MIWTLLLSTMLLLLPVALAAQTPSITWTASTPTRVNPADAVRILQGNQSIMNLTDRPIYPPDRFEAYVVSSGSDPTAGPYGPFVPFYLSLPDRRLDGSLYSDFPWMAGSLHGGWGSSFSGHRRGVGSGFVSGDGFSRLVLRGQHGRGSSGNHTQLSGSIQTQTRRPAAPSPVSRPGISSAGHPRPSRSARP